MEILAELTELLLKIIGAGIVMIFHELPKAIVAHRVTTIPFIEKIIK